ncbi:MAG: hypothetical protein AAGJ85_08970 [Pseudomonadota bacterium]
MVVPELMASQNLSETAAWLLYFCWHDGTVALFVSGIALGYSAAKPGNRVLAVFATGLILGIGLLGLGIAALGDAILFGTPAPYAFNIIGIVATLGIFLDRRSA